eukprot:scaffold35458_cov37-Cyclotella_meneghiniana.AAC.2
MKLAIATAFIAIAASMPATSSITSGVAASIHTHENNKGSFLTAAAKKQGVECTLANTADVRSSAADLRVLSSCGVREVCVKDSTSKIGGRCELLLAAALEPRRELEDCEKCSSTTACGGGTDQSQMGCGSCLSDYVCYALSSSVTIGAGSCVGRGACHLLTGELNIVWL